MRSLPLVALGFALALASAQPSLVAQDPSKPPPNGPRKVEPGWHAIVGATAVIAPGQTVENATIVIRDGRIASVAAGAAPPQGARVWQGAGLSVYAAFVDPHVAIDVPAPDPNAPGSHWNDKVTPQRSALDGAGVTPALAKELRELGFGAAAIAPDDGIFRGSAAVVQLGEVDDGERRPVVADRVFQDVSFQRAFGGYPSSLMGMIALVRQTFYDADWDADKHDGWVSAAGTRSLFGDASPGAKRTALGALRGAARILFDTVDELDVPRAARIQREFSLPAGRTILLGSGLEFRRLEAVRDAGLPIVLPLAFPEAPTVDSLAARERTTLRDMLTWEQAPTNPARLCRAGIALALTTDKLRKRSDFHENLRLAIRQGLSKDDALEMLTTRPAGLLGVGDQLGRIEAGFRANLLVVDGDVFDQDATRRAIWIDGRRHELEPPAASPLKGSWSTTMTLAGLDIDALEFDSEKSLALRIGDKKAKAKKLRRKDRQIEFLADLEDLGGTGVVTAHAMIHGRRMLGTAVDAAGARTAWTATRSADEVVADASEGREDESPESIDLDRPLPVPLGAFGVVDAGSSARRIRVERVTLWTAGEAGIIDNGVLLVADGKIVFAGRAEDVPEGFEAERTIGGGGVLHVTPGLIDCHSHTGISRGINEGTQAVTSEVRIGDVIDPDDIAWYRELAGGLTLVNQLHGSANPIGGQNSVVKIRWGAALPDDMKVAGAIPGIKFALGENVKRSRSRDSTRYPRTRMGVEALIRDRFIAAREYAAAFERWEQLPAGRRKDSERPRRDLELEALAEVLRGERLVHCHSYRQDEILMLCRVADEFGFKIGTFQHGLEGYKVAEVIKDAAIGASIFTDWWAYKVEAFDAIPENAAIMHDVGVVVSFNSDSGELARRLNTEASKAVKYGGVPPNEALKMVTLNAATQLGIADRVGSLENGKDADFVIWSGSPLSGFSRCLNTFIDGKEYWSEERHEQLVAHAHAERQRLIQKLLTVDSSKRKGTRPDIEGTLDNRPGDCGCNLLEVR